MALYARVDRASRPLLLTTVDAVLRAPLHRGCRTRRSCVMPSKAAHDSIRIGNTMAAGKRKRQTPHRNTAGQERVWTWPSCDQAWWYDVEFKVSTKRVVSKGAFVPGLNM